VRFGRNRAAGPSDGYGPGGPAGEHRPGGPAGGRRFGGLAGGRRFGGLAGGRRFGGLLRQRRFRLLWIGETVSQLGNAMAVVGVPLVAVIVLHASTFVVGVLTAAG